MRGLSRADIWRRRYALRPYLRSAPQAHVDQRIQDVMSNLMVLTDKGQIAPLPIGPELEYWSELFTHLLEECNHRGGVAKSAIQNLQVINATFPDIPKAVTALSSITPPTKNTFFAKFSKQAFASDLYEKGRIRIAPASFYSDPTLNPAINDDELSVTAYYSMAEAAITERDEAQGTREVKIKPTTDIKRSIRSSSDYYVWCMAMSLDLRLFDDFDVDACVVIRDRERFLRLLKAQMEKYCNGLFCFDSAVNYFDPYNFGFTSDIDPFTYKHFRYWYQRDYRCLWLPASPQPGPLEPIFLELGSVRDFADYVQL